LLLKSDVIRQKKTRSGIDGKAKEKFKTVNSKADKKRGRDMKKGGGRRRISTSSGRA